MEKLNELVEGSPYAGRPLDEVVTRAAKDLAEKSIFNNAAQAWNCDFYWRSMRPKGGGTPGGALWDAIERDIGELAELRTAFAKAAAGEFGSGWAWPLADKGRKLKIATTDDADTPIVRGARRAEDGAAPSIVLNDEEADQQASRRHTQSQCQKI